MSLAKNELTKNGYWVQRNFLPKSVVNEITALMEQLYDRDQFGVDGKVIGQSKKAVGGRNVLDHFDRLEPIVQQAGLFPFASSLMGKPCFLVRGLYFDKPNGQTWSLPWHQDLSIAVKNHIRQELAKEIGFSNATKKAGTFHYQAPKDLLESMVTLRLSLDPMEEGNGPIQYLPGSHLWENFDSSGNPCLGNESFIQELRGDSGDVFVMSPLLVHASGNRSQHCENRRRVLHLEFCTQEQLPSGLQWRWCFSGDS